MDLCVLLTVSQTRKLALHPSRTRMGAPLPRTLGNSCQFLTFYLFTQLLCDCGQSLNLARLNFLLCKNF